MAVGTSGNSCEVCAQIRIFVEIDPRGLVFKYSSMWKLDGWELFLFFSLLPQVRKVNKAAFRRRAGSSGPCVLWHCSSSLRSWPASCGGTWAESMQVRRRRRRPGSRKCSPWKKVSRVLASARLCSPQSQLQNNESLSVPLTFLHDFDWLAESCEMCSGPQLWPCILHVRHRCMLTPEVPVYPPPVPLIPDSGGPIRNLHMHISLFHTAKHFLPSRPPVCSVAPPPFLAQTCPHNQTSLSAVSTGSFGIIRWRGGLSSRCKKTIQKKKKSLLPRLQWKKRKTSTLMWSHRKWMMTPSVNTGEPQSCSAEGIRSSKVCWTNDAHIFMKSPWVIPCCSRINLRAVC